MATDRDGCAVVMESVAPFSSPPLLIRLDGYKRLQIERPRTKGEYNYYMVILETDDSRFDSRATPVSETDMSCSQFSGESLK